MLLFLWQAAREEFIPKRGGIVATTHNSVGENRAEGSFLAFGGNIKPLECIFCNEPETVHHLFFYCIVSRNIWPFINGFLVLH